MVWIVILGLTLVLAALLMWQTDLVHLSWNVALLLILCLVVYLWFTPAWLSPAFWIHRAVTLLRWIATHPATLLTALGGYYLLAYLAGWSAADTPWMAVLLKHTLWIGSFLGISHWIAVQFVRASPLTYLADRLEQSFRSLKDSASAAILRRARPKLFLVMNQLYTLPEARALASSVFQGRLATSAEVQRASALGLDWNDVPGWTSDGKVVSPCGDGSLNVATYTEDQAQILHFGAIIYGVRPTLSEFEKQLLEVGPGSASELVALKMQYIKDRRTDFATIFATSSELDSALLLKP
jgi:hypothetical protein